MTRPQLTTFQIQEKLARYCAYQERCEFEVREKAKKFEVYGEALDQLIDFLVDEKYLDEDRFAGSFVRGKFRIQKWGKIKIKAHLRNKRVSESLIEKHIQLIPSEEYLNTIAVLLERKDKNLTVEDDYIRTQKLVLYLQQKGFELDDIFKVLKKERLDD